MDGPRIKPQSAKDDDDPTYAVVEIIDALPLVFIVGGVRG
jgi:hypothetical protein